MASKLLFIVLPYLSLGIFLAGVFYRFWVWGRTSVPLRIVTTPAPRTRGGVTLRLIGDALWFPSLYKGDKVLWAAGLSFHLLLWLVLLRHLRYFLFPIPGWVEGIQTVGLYAGYLIPIPLAAAPGPAPGRREKPVYLYPGGLLLPSSPPCDHDHRGAARALFQHLPG